MAKLDPEVLAHLEWLGFVRPTGLIVSAPALVRAGAILDRRDTEGQRLLRACTEDRTFDLNAGPVSYLPDFRRFAEAVLGWSFSAKGYAGTSDSQIPPELEVALPDYGETLRPDFAVRELEPRDGASGWQLLVRVLETDEDFDRIGRAGGQLEASPHGRMERLLRQTGVPAGLLFNGRAIRLLSAPKGESSGWLDFRVSEMVQTGGRPISTALRLLLSQSRLLSLPRAQRLAALLEDSRKFQNEVSERLAQQVLHALYELLRGFQAAQDASKGSLLREPLAENPDEVYRALLTTILRLVFLLYAEERDMLPEDETFLRYYSLAGLHERLREDASLYPDTMDQRFGAWAQLLVLFRLIHDGADAGAMRLPERHGVLFDPDRYPFLEGRVSGGARQIHERVEAPLVPDGTIYRALEKLLILDGERISYRALDVEQIGSVYETMMGFRLETATGRSVAIKAQKKQGAPTTVDLEALLREPSSKREKWLQDRTDRKLSDSSKRAVAAAATLEDLHAALLATIDTAATPDLVPRGAMVLQPGEERRRSGSHYTPRALTEPIVRKTLEPILLRLRGVDDSPPRPARILELKICDPAMGSGAFLVETCRQLADALVEAWRSHGELPVIPPDEDEVVYARRLVAQRCIYGVDRNPIAVDLAKVSLWLVTLAREHALTFVDHALRHGDSLLGLSLRQIESFHWNTDIIWESPFRARMRNQLRAVAELRHSIREAGENVSDWERRDTWDKAQFELSKVRIFGDLVLAAYFMAEKPKDRERKRSEFVSAVVDGSVDRYLSFLEEWRHADKPLVPFHWALEFPEVFDREDSGFDAFVGNPPFMSSTSGWSILGPEYRDFLRHLHPGSDGRAVDLVAHFFRRAFSLLRASGTLGLIATNTIGQGDTRLAGLHHICVNGGKIYNVITRYRWPGSAAVIVSIIHVVKDTGFGSATRNGNAVAGINSFLVAGTNEINPQELRSNDGLSFHGSKIYGEGFTFDDDGLKGLATPLSEMRRLLEADHKNADRVFPYIGGEELNSDPAQAHRRFVISFGRMSLEEAQQWPDLLKIVEAKVLPQRSQMGGYALAERRNAFWWQFETYSIALHEAIRGLDRCLALSRVSANLALAFQPTDRIFADSLVVFPFDQYAPFSVLQSRIHELWARFLGSSMKDDLRYSPSDCFHNFPFPTDWRTHPALERAGSAYYEQRASQMLRSGEGLTKTYNRFHDPDEGSTAIASLRVLHTAMDRAVLDAYGWTDIATECEFLLDYEIDEDEWGNKKKPYHYRWPDEVRDEVLARLLELNAARAKEEARAGASTSKKGSVKATTRPRKSSGSETGDLFS